MKQILQQYRSKAEERCVVPLRLPQQEPVLAFIKKDSLYCFVKYFFYSSLFSSLTFITLPSFAGFKVPAVFYMYQIPPPGDVSFILKFKAVKLFKNFTIYIVL